MTVMELLKTTKACIRAGDTYLSWDRNVEFWEVYRQADDEQHSTPVLDTTDEADAVEAFIRSAGIED